MKYILESNNLSDYLQSDRYIDFDNKAIEEKALELYHSSLDEIENAKIMYDFVRDQISHSGDINSERVTKTASEVLLHKEGICVVKSFLLAALLRCIHIPAGLCYQKLTKGDSAESGYVIHGLNAVFLKNTWVRLDARGNKKNVHAEFSVDIEKVAFPVKPEFNEIDYPIIYAKPPKKVIDALKKYNDRKIDSWEIDHIN
jgi:transglutaminase-like putative cysteine protease